MSVRPETDDRWDGTVARRFPLAVAGFSAGIFLFEVLLTRVLSVTLFHHFAFAAISVGMLGLAASGVHVALAPGRFRPERAQADVTAAGVWFGAAGLVAVALLVRLGIYPAFSWNRLLRLVTVYAVCLVPFYFGGMGLALLLTHGRRRFGRLYACDLAAAGAAGLLVSPMLRWLGGPGAVAAASLLAAATALAAFPGAPRALRRLGVCVLAAGLLLLASDARWATLRLRQPKEDRKGERLTFEAWNALSRVAVYDIPMWPGSLGPRYKGPVAPGLWMDIDAGAATPVVSAAAAEKNEYLRYELTSLAHVVAPKGRALVIGPGGGRDVLSALLHGTEHVDAVEINPIIVDEIMRGRLRAWSAGLYDDPRVSVYVADGRSFVRASRERYDLIQLSMVDTWAATAAGALALSENNLYTVEAVREYLGHLSPEGVLTLTRWAGGETYRLVVLVHATARGLGIADPGRHMAVVQHPATAGALPAVNLIWRAAPFDEASVAPLRAQVEAAGFLWLHDPLQPVLGRVSDMARARDALAEARRTEDYDLAPPTDDRPFFFYRPRRFLAGLGEDPRRLFQEGQYLIATVLAFSGLLGGATILVPLWKGGRDALRAAPGTAAVAAPYFVGIGVGFMLVEMAIMQRFVLYLGHPTRAMTAVVAGLLVGAGLGSASSGLLGGGTRAPAFAAAAAIVLLGMSNAAHGRLFAATQQLGLPAKIALTELLVVPLGVGLGTLMPLGIERLLRRQDGLVPWAWGVNGFASVVGACGGALIAVAFGFSVTLAGGALCYAVAGLAALAAARRATVAPDAGVGSPG
jgi:hypothetical protein